MQNTMASLRQSEKDRLCGKKRQREETDEADLNWVTENAGQRIETGDAALAATQTSSAAGTQASTMSYSLSASTTDAMQSTLSAPMSQSVALTQPTHHVPSASVRSSSSSSSALEVDDAFAFEEALREMESSRKAIASSFAEEDFGFSLQDEEIANEMYA